jgi:hypothetical protein
LRARAEERWQRPQGNSCDEAEDKSEQLKCDEKAVAIALQNEITGRCQVGQPPGANGCLENEPESAKGEEEGVWLKRERCTAHRDKDAGGETGRPGQLEDAGQDENSRHEVAVSQRLRKAAQDDRARDQHKDERHEPGES